MFVECRMENKFLDISKSTLREKSVLFCPLGHDYMACWLVLGLLMLTLFAPSHPICTKNTYYTLPLRYLFCTFSSTSYSSAMYRAKQTSSHDGAGWPPCQSRIRADCRWERSGHKCSISVTFESGIWRPNGRLSFLHTSGSFISARTLRTFSIVREGSIWRKRGIECNVYQY